uniref:Uncharacterized protein n=1 Tax=viral metagenome TaxID=1070528 RepID=A0A6C0ESS5_9ZZZZ
MDSSDDSKKNFFKHVFNFDDDSKADIINIIQYSLLAIIPVVILNKSMSKYVPEADDKKGSLEISAEIVIQIIVMFIGLLIVHRIITFVPTYSGADYPEFHIVYNVLSVLMITLSLQTKLGEKISILVDRLVELWEGKTNTKKNNKKSTQGTVKVTQPISGQSMNQSAMNQAMYSDGTSISSLPTNDMAMSVQNTMAPQQLPNYNNMYQQDNTPLVGAASPGMSEGFVNEPMAANSVLGGGAFGSW